MTEPITKEERETCVENANDLRAGVGKLYGDLDSFMRGQYASEILSYEAALAAAEARIEKLEGALNERDLFINPHLMEQAADEIECGASCENIRREYDTNVAWCRKSEKGEYCPNDLADTLRAVAKAARAALGETDD